MLPQGAATPPLTSSSTTSASLPKSSHSSLMSNPGDLVRGAVFKHLARTWDAAVGPVPPSLAEAKHQKPLNTRPCHLPLPPTAAPASKKPAPYPSNLTPMPSHLCPHCLAQDRLQQWTPASTHPTAPSSSTLSKAEHKHIKDTMAHAWDEDTCTSYSAGLLMWHCFCDSKGIPEAERAPATQSLLSAFIAHMAAAYSGKTISNYLNGVCAWHVTHSINWALEKRDMETMLQAANKLTPSTLRRKKCLPYTPTFMSEIRQHLNLEEPLYAAIFTCLTTCFYASARLGEFTVCTLGAFDPNKHVTIQNLSHDQDQNSYKVTVLHLPSTKVTSREGKDVYWASQDGDTDLTATLQNHLWVNQPSEGTHLFTYQAKHAQCPLTKNKFLERVVDAACAAGLELLQGHGIRIGSTLKYLLHSVPFDMMKVQGQWAGDSFLLYLWKHAVVIAPYIQAKTTVHKAFI
jgi:hypothetical protein